MDITCWKKDYETGNYENIVNKYNEVESIVSQLELCLADYENRFNMNGISYSIYKIGKDLINIRKEVNDDKSIIRSSTSNKNRYDTKMDV